MMRPIDRTLCVFGSIMLLLWANHDFLTGPYGGPHWLLPIDFVATQVLVYCLIMMMVDGVRYRERRNKRS